MSYAWESESNQEAAFYYIAIALTIIFLLNAFVFPSLLARQVQEVGYSDFLQWVDAGKVSEVSLDSENDQIVFLAANGESGEIVYKTAVFPDDGLRERLEAAGVKFSAQIPTPE